MATDSSHDTGAGAAHGDSPEPHGAPSQHDYTHASAGWGAAKSVGEVIWKTREPFAALRVMPVMNHPEKGFDCPGCAWPDAYDGLHLDLCENGIKHATWEMTPKRADRELFAAHTVRELREWSDFALEDQGRLTEPMAYDPDTDHYVPISWADAFQLFADTMRDLGSPNEAAFYTSGRLSNEATFLYQLMVREIGTNNLPDCSNMCHEASGRALTASLGTGKGTVDLQDLDACDAWFVMGVNAASNAPRMLTALAAAYRRGTQIVHVNPMLEAASGRTIVPHDLLSMGLMRAVRTGTLDLQPLIGGDMALMRGIAKATLAAAEAGEPAVLDEEFLSRFTEGFEAYRDLCAGTAWEDIEAACGLPRERIEEAARVYREAGRTVVSWCLGLTQQEHGVDTIREIVNVLMLRGNIGREGAGPCPIRGHSNVQGNRTCGIDHRPSEAFLDRLAGACGIDPPREPGLDTVRTVEAMHRGDVKVFVGMGGNFARAAPDTAYTAEALRRCALTVHVSTKLNRSHLEHGHRALILPCLGRTEKDTQATGVQSVSVEDSMSMVHLSKGVRRPASTHLLSEPAIIAGLARAALPDSGTRWQWYVEDYDRIRDTMQKALEGFEDFNRRVRQRPNGFRLRQPARERVFLTPSGKAEFSLAPLYDATPPTGLLTLATVRSHDQWNTTIYSDDDRYRGVRNLRTLLFMHLDDMRERGITELGLIDITSIAKDGTRRTVRGYTALAYDVPRGNVVGYMPELNMLCAAADFSPQSDQPLMKHVTVDIVPAEPGRWDVTWSADASSKAARSDAPGA
ncbi:FdhF/YdeP family oxidoreductase [Yinghuangia seranimata]|uniref:FdhF/YdeP family oxidoreductase n=1 Tax=Yinghuangia seranimata TaxID=408067 RepID=UPI00248B2817|nr:FdhF/YdeP family oxidoreductase [Yinghuangia seranimata]MDI2125712.1 FdhF/YdeP family oxidoreductase [Yinghuangia seranimata]